MSLFKKLLFSIGVGGATVETELLQSKVRIGENLEGIINIIGGEKEQTINRVVLRLKSEYEIKEDDFHTRTAVINLGDIEIDKEIIINPHEVKDIRFSVTIPDYAPISMKKNNVWKNNVWIETDLEIPFTIDPNDRDYIQIEPSENMEIVLDAMINELGFRLREVECIEFYKSNFGFTQEFEFIPKGIFKNKLDEAEIVFLPTCEGIELFMQIDRRVNGIKSFFEEIADLDETHINFFLSNDEIMRGSSYVAGILEDIISEHCE